MISYSACVIHAGAAPELTVTLVIEPVVVQVSSQALVAGFKFLDAAFIVNSVRVNVSERETPTLSVNSVGVSNVN